MPKIKILSGKDVVKILATFGFKIKNQKGSHVKLSRIINNNEQILTIPFHKEIDKGTAKAIFRQTLRYIPENELKKYFFI
jgi:predicted RNA binding protein YcfA (HicA-like mRNA interferase family)